MMVLRLGGLAWLALNSSFSADIPALHWEPSLFRKVWQPLLLLGLSITLLVGLRQIKQASLRNFLAFGLVTLTALDLASFGVPIFPPRLTSPSFYGSEPAYRSGLMTCRRGNLFRILSFEAARDD